MAICLMTLFHRKLHLHELQTTLPEYAALPRGEWLLAVQALRLEDVLDGKFLLDGTFIADAAALYITKRGRQRLETLSGRLGIEFNMAIDAQGGPLKLPDEQLQVFLCHSSADKEVVRDLFGKLVRDGFKPWLDEENILPGQDWNTEIRRAVRNSHVVVVCLSRSSITKEGYVQKGDQTCSRRCGREAAGHDLHNSRAP
jgi:TIR domain